MSKLCDKHLWKIINCSIALTQYLLHWCESSLINCIILDRSWIRRWNYRIQRWKIVLDLNWATAHSNDGSTRQIHTKDKHIGKYNRKSWSRSDVLNPSGCWGSVVRVSHTPAQVLWILSNFWEISSSLEQTLNPMWSRIDAKSTQDKSSDWLSICKKIQSSNTIFLGIKGWNDSKVGSIHFFIRKN